MWDLIVMLRDNYNMDDIYLILDPDRYFFISPLSSRHCTDIRLIAFQLMVHAAIRYREYPTPRDAYLTFH